MHNVHIVTVNCHMRDDMNILLYDMLCDFMNILVIRSHDVFHEHFNYTVT